MVVILDSLSNKDLLNFVYRSSLSQILKFYRTNSSFKEFFEKNEEIIRKRLKLYCCLTIECDQNEDPKYCMYKCNVTFLADRLRREALEAVAGPIAQSHRLTNCQLEGLLHWRQEKQYNITFQSADEGYKKLWFLSPKQVQLELQYGCADAIYDHPKFRELIIHAEKVNQPGCYTVPDNFDISPACYDLRVSCHQRNVDHLVNTMESITNLWLIIFEDWTVSDDLLQRIVTKSKNVTQLGLLSRAKMTMTQVLYLIDNVSWEIPALLSIGALVLNRAGYDEFQRRYNAQIRRYCVYINIKEGEFFKNSMKLFINQIFDEEGNQIGGRLRAE